MQASPNFSFTELLIPTLIICLLYLLTSYYWKRRWLYYHTSKIPGPFNFPLIGAAHIFLNVGHEDLLDVTIKNVRKYLGKYGPIGKVWLGGNLFVTTVRPQDLEILLPRCLEKGPVYSLSEDYFKQSLLIGPLKIWKEHRKIINQTFTTNILHSFIPIFIKQANYLRDTLNENCDRIPKEIFHKVWKFTFAVSCETIGDVDPNLLEGKDEFLEDFHKFELMAIKRFLNPLLHIDFVWKISTLGKEVQLISQRARDFINQMINIRKSLPQSEENKKRFLNHLLNSDKMTHEDILQETPFMMLASSESSAVVTCSVFIILGLYPEIQEKIFKELDSIFADSNQDITRDDVNRMGYLERVIKETMRVLTPVPFFFRCIGEDVALESCVFPAGSHLIVPAAYIHQSEDLWPNPSKFDPDRFLPEEVEKRPRLAYLPFSFGPRNCIGFRYGLLSIKITLATILRSYKVAEAVDYKKLEDVEQTFNIVTKAKKGYRIRFEKRNT